MTAVNLALQTLLVLGLLVPFGLLYVFYGYGIIPNRIRCYWFKVKVLSVKPVKITASSLAVQVQWLCEDLDYQMLTLNVIVENPHMMNMNLLYHPDVILPSFVRDRILSAVVDYERLLRENKVDSRKQRLRKAFAESTNGTL